MEEGVRIKHDIGKAPKTGDWRYMHPEVDKEKCIGCETCAPFCPEASINLEPRNSQLETQKTKEEVKVRVTGYASIDYYFCKGCGVCAQVCPVKAILMKKK